MKIRNNRERFVFVFVTTALSLLGSLVLTSFLSPTGLSPQALLPSVTVPLVVAPLASNWGARKMQHVYELNAELKRVLEHDALSGLLNRCAFFDLFLPDVEPGSGALLLVEIDGFKSINEGYGHEAGDQVIALTARALKVQTAAGGIAARMGNAEFAVFVPADNGRDPLRVAEQIRERVAQMTLPADHASLTFTVSIGIEKRESGDDIDSTLRRADQALSDAKLAGSNLVRQYQYLALV